MWTKDKKAHAKIIVQAIVLAITIHALLLLLFRTPSAAPLQETTRTNHISLLPANSGRFDLNAFNNWLTYADPTLVAKPNEEFGYNLLVRHHGLRPKNQTVEVGHIDGIFDFSLIISRPASLDINRHPIIPRLPDFNLPTPQPLPLLRFPIIVTSDGKTIQGVFAGIANIDEIIKTSPITGPSVILIGERTSEMRLPRVRLLQSCGDPTLDQLSMRTLISSVSLINGGSNDKTLSVYWKPEGEASK